MQYVNLEQIADILNGYNFKSSNYVNHGVRVIRITNVQQGYLEDKDPVFYEYTKDLDKYMLKENDLLMSLTGNVGRVGMLVPSLLPAGLNQRVACIRCKNDNFNIKFLFYFFNNELFRKNAVSNSNGVAQLNLSTEWLKKVKIPAYDENKQYKIVEEIDNIVDLIDNTKKHLTNLDNIVKSQFIEMFGDLTSNYDYPKFKIDDLAFVTKLAGFEFTEYINYQSSGDIIMLRGLNCKNGKLVLDDIKWIDVETSKKLPRSQLFNGDILMTYAGTVGDVALVDEDDKYHLAPNVAKISLNDKSSNNPIFFIHLFMFTKDYILSNTAGVAQMALSMKKIRDFEYHIPPIELQNKFANFVQQIDKSKFIIHKQIKLLEELLDKKMHEYFGD